MASSQNGFRAVETYGPPLITTMIPGTDVKYLGGLLPIVNPIAMYIGHRWNTEIEPIRQDGGLWGYNYRLIRGQTVGLSNHSSGTAGDIMAALHPLGTRTLSRTALRVLEDITSEVQGTIRFGAFYDGRPDEMHWEAIENEYSLGRINALLAQGALSNTPSSLIVGIGGGGIGASRPHIPDPQVPEPEVPEPQPVLDDQEEPMFFMHSPGRPVVIVVDGRAGNLEGLDYDATVKGFRDAGVKEINFSTDAAFDAVLRVTSGK